MELPVFSRDRLANRPYFCTGCLDFVRDESEVKYSRGQAIHVLPLRYYPHIFKSCGKPVKILTFGEDENRVFGYEGGKEHELIKHLQEMRARTDRSSKASTAKPSVYVPFQNPGTSGNQSKFVVGQQTAMPYGHSHQAAASCSNGHKSMIPIPIRVIRRRASIISDRQQALSGQESTSNSINADSISIMSNPIQIKKSIGRRPFFKRKPSSPSTSTFSEESY